MPRNPPAIPPDTSPEVWRRQMAAIRSRTPQQRMEEFAALLKAGAEMEDAAVRRRHPHYSDRQVFLAVVRARYGDDLAGKAWPDCLDVAI